MIEGGVLLPFGAVLTAAVILVLYRRRWPLWRLAVVAAFCVYLIGVALETLFPIVAGNDLGRGAFSLREVVHLRAFEGMFTSSTTRLQSFLNVVLGVPFGLLLPLLGVRSAWKVLVLGLLFAVGIESLQLLEDVVSHSEFRTVDINDVILNWLGVVIGLACCWVLSVAAGRWLPLRRVDTADI